MTDLHALEAVRLAAGNLAAAVDTPGDLTVRENMMLASLHAGLAFSNASLGAVHAMAHSLGGLLDLAHGECNAMLVHHVLEFNAPAVGERYPDLCQAMGLNGSSDLCPSPHPAIGVGRSIRNPSRSVPTR